MSALYVASDDDQEAQLILDSLCLSDVLCLVLRDFSP
jgi:hypothetical protein